MAVFITVGFMKRDFLTRIADTDTTQDTAIQKCIDGVIPDVIDYLDDDDITTADDLPSALTRPLMKQIAFEYSRKNDVGLSAISIGDANVSKIEPGEWLPSVKDALDRHITHQLGGDSL